MAVCIFFLLSGTVLRYAFEPPTEPIGGNLVRRIIRLGLPLIAACGIGFFVRLFGHEGMHAVGATSAWIAEQDRPLTLMGSLLDGTAWILTGFSNTTLFGAISNLLPDVRSSVDSPIWSLHVELWGSFMMLAVVASGRLAAGADWLAIAAFVLLCGMNPITLFLFGYVAAPIAVRDARWPILGLCFIGAGMIASGYVFSPGLGRLERFLAHVAVFRTTTFFGLASLTGAVLIYIGVLMSGPARRGLSLRPFRWLGQMSFSIYLLHLPLLFSLGFTLSRNYGVLIGCAATFAATLALAILFERWVDQPATRLSRYAGRRLAAIWAGRS